MAVPRADRLAKVDAEGVMHWTDDGSEVALAALEMPAYHARPAADNIFGWKMDDVPRQWGDRMPLALNVSAIGYGRWLYGDTLDKPHGYEISSIKVEF